MFSESKYRRDIQVLRGLSVLAVVLFHAEETYFPLGYLGVDVFFVISGYVVTPLILRIFTEEANGGGLLSNLRYFYKRRFYRLAPALALVLTISAITIFLLGPIADHQKFSKQGIATLLLGGNVGAYRYSGNYFSPNPSPLVHTWSLSVEEQIYLLLPIFFMIFLNSQRMLRKDTIVLLGSISAISFVSFLFPTILQPLYSRIGIELAPQFSFYSPVDRIWQFTVGGLVFLMLNSYQNGTKTILKGINSVTLISIFMILFSPIDLNSKVSSIFATLIAVTLIVFKSLDALPGSITSKLEWLGDRSYSIYLVHMPLLYVAKYSPATQLGNGENRIVQSMIAVVASIILGALSYSKIEKRYRIEDRDFTSLKNVVTALVLTLAIPLILFGAMDIGAKRQYWGIDRNIPVPPYAGDLDPKCARDSEIGPPCIYTNVGAGKTVLLLGDSHAGHISQAVVDAAKSANWNAVVWAHYDCPVQFQRSVKEQVSDQCLTVNKQMKDWILRNKPTAIIVSQYVRSDSSQNDLRNALFTLKSIVPKILLIENNPIFPDEKDFMVARPLVMSAYQPPKSFDLSKMQMKDRNASDQLGSWARTNGISTMNFTSLFCTKEKCTRYAGSHWLYRDDDHFSVAGAELTIPKLSTFLKRL